MAVDILSTLLMIFYAVYEYPISDKFDALKKLMIFKTKVEKQRDKVIKFVRFEWSGEHYGKHISIGQFKRPFAKYLKDYGIVAQYIILGNPELNGVTERHNHTLKDMLRTMMSRNDLPISHWGKALKATMYILNKTSNKFVPKIPFEL